MNNSDQRLALAQFVGVLQEDIQERSEVSLNQHLDAADDFRHIGSVGDGEHDLDSWRMDFMLYSTRNYSFPVRITIENMDDGETLINHKLEAANKRITELEVQLKESTHDTI